MSLVIAIGLLLIVFSIIAIILFYKIKQTQDDAALWVSLPGRAAKAIVAPPQTLETLDLAFSYALAALTEHGPWKNPAVALEGLRIIVNAADSWKDSTGSNVGGQAYFMTIAVGQDLSALCHEMIHALEFALDGKVDNAHQTWLARGLQRADNAYRAKWNQRASQKTL